VGEVTAYADSVNEIMKLLRKAELVRAKYSREPKKIMVALNVKRGVLKEIEGIARERGSGADDREGRGLNRAKRARFVFALDGLACF
jgi:hypothetical protein